MKKLIIIGPAGSGKSTLAKELAEKLQVTHTELDSINHQAHWTPIDKDEFRRIVGEEVKKDGWVFCGNYFSTLGIDFWKHADAIIWLDYSFPLVMGRLVRRTVARSLKRQELWNGNRESFLKNFFTTDSVIFWMMKSWNKQQRTYGPIFENEDGLLPTRLIRLKSPKETQDFLKLSFK